MDEEDRYPVEEGRKLDGIYQLVCSLLASYVRRLNKYY